MESISFEEARNRVLVRARAMQLPLAVEDIELTQASGRVAAHAVVADRDYPPAARSIRDGYAIQLNDFNGICEVIGEVRAGQPATMSVGAGQAVEIMTGAPIPAGADAVIMVEHTTRSGSQMCTDRRPQPGEFINPAGSEARKGAVVVPAGEVFTFPRIAMAATVGATRVSVYRKPRVAILSTGDEVISIAATPRDYEVRNSNAWSLAAQVERAGGVPTILPVAADLYNPTRELTEAGLQHDLLLLSGGVSAGKYDIVETVLADLGAEFFFTRVAIQPGQPVVFGRACGKFFFGLPGNPASTMVCFEVFAKAMVQLLGGRTEPEWAFGWATLAHDFRHKSGLTRFLPARLENGTLTHVPWQGSSDVPSLARANCFLIADAGRDSWAAGDWIRFLPI